MYSSTHSLTSALDGGEWSASCPGRFTPKERAPGTHWIGGWVGPRAVLDVVLHFRVLTKFVFLIIQQNRIFLAYLYRMWAVSFPSDGSEYFFGTCLILYEYHYVCWSMYYNVNNEDIRGKKVKLSLCLMKTVGTGWIIVVSFTPRLLYPRGKRLRYPLDRWLCGTQSLYGRGGEKNPFIPPVGNRTPVVINDLLNCGFTGYKFL
jgi:hypothetical protein